MREIALHIMDIAENGITAGAACVHILVHEARSENWLKIEIRDDGEGIPSDMLNKVTDPFVTARTTRRVGLGLSLLKTAAERCEGDFAILSEPGKGTRITATFRYDHIDRAPIGDMAGSVSMLIMGNPDVDFVYTHTVDASIFTMDTREIRRELGEDTLADPSVIIQLTQSIRKKVFELRSEK
ncbi:ATP-binding protein [Desulfonema magnum]|uniref:histidine kinase n=1 Tax=Desulfonema magnum TaxID=45655 RepID=A0A975BKJ2_9BACT|nr:ATP-binding protein [Desulfonema magnum]QTA87409.1 Histidine kinase domain-containing protein [Desulfonema magnum]